MTYERTDGRTSRLSLSRALAYIAKQDKNNKGPTSWVQVRLQGWRCGLVVTRWSRWT